MNPALWNGKFGGSFKRILTTDSRNVIVFLRQKDDNKVVVMLNLTAKPRTVMLREGIEGEFTELFSQNKTQLKRYQKFTLSPWAYYVWSSKNMED